MINPVDIPFGYGTFQDALDAHRNWLNSEGGRKLIIPGMFNLSYANLSYANLSYANHIIRVGPSSDGYEFFGVLHADGVVWIKAGCRWFTVEDARKHWKETRGGTELGAERLRFVNFIADHFKALQ